MLLAHHLQRDMEAYVMNDRWEGKCKLRCRGRGAHSLSNLERKTDIWEHVETPHECCWRGDALMAPLAADSIQSRP